MSKRQSRLAIYLVLLVTALCFIPLRSLRFEFNIEKLFPAGDPDLAYFQEFQQQFQSHVDDEYIFIGLTNNKGIFQKDFLTKADSLTRYLLRLERIVKVYSLTSSNAIYFRNNEINARPVVHTYQPEFYPQDSVYLFQSPEYRDLLISKDGRSIAVAAFNEQNLGDQQKEAILNGIEKRVRDLDFDRYHVTAKIRTERAYVSEIIKNFRIYIIVCLTFIAITLYLVFRSIRQVIIPMAIIAISLVWTLSLISLTGNSLDIISSLIPPILAAICMSDIIHVSSKYIEELRAGIPKQQALIGAYKEVGLATFYTCLTVDVGFLTLSITDIIPIRTFGIFAAAGILLSFCIAMVLLFAFYTLTPIPSLVHRQSSEQRWTKILAFSFRFVIRNRNKVLLTLAIVTLLSAFFTSKVEINSRLLQEIPKGHPMLDDYKFMEKEFAGTRPFEMVLTVVNDSTSFYDIGMMKKVEEIERYLKDSCNIGYVISPLSMFRAANKAFNGGENSFYRIPESQERVARYYEGIMQTEYADEFGQYMLPDGSRIRISGRQPDLSIKEFAIVSERIERFIKSRYSSLLEHKVTGSAYLLDKAVYSLTDNLFTGIWIDAVLIAIIALLILRNWRIVLIVLIPNMVPLLVMGAVMGILGINLKADTSVIFAIAFAIAVDDTIHFLSRVRIELNKGLTLSYAVKRSYLSTGKAMLITTIILLTGFLTLLSSSFGGAFYIGLLISVCLSFAVVLDLTVLPVLLLMFYRKQ